jgi:Holliday junction resolvase-like predicted endonuclease
MELTQEQKGKIGETAVMLELLKKGFNVININNSYPNYKNVDLICMNANNGKSVMIQVKTGTTHNILTGFTSEFDGTIQKLEESIIGPWVFVYMPDNKMSNMEFYILTREEVIELISSSNKWYATEYYRKLKKKYPVGVYVDWLEGGSSKATKLHPEYKSTLHQPSKDNWYKITELLE